MNTRRWFPNPTTFHSVALGCFFLSIRKTNHFFFPSPPSTGSIGVFVISNRRVISCCRYSGSLLPPFAPQSSTRTLAEYTSPGPFLYALFTHTPAIPCWRPSLSVSVCSHSLRETRDPGKCCLRSALFGDNAPNITLFPFFPFLPFFSPT